MTPFDSSIDKGKVAMVNMDDLFKRYLNNSCTEEELRILLRYFKLGEPSENIRLPLEQELLKAEEAQELPEPLVQMVARNRHVLMDKIKASDNKTSKTKRFFVTISIAAITFLVATLLYLHVDRQPEDITPGTNRATLSLENGQAIVLNEDKKGITVGEKGISYMDGKGITANTAVQYATLSTPRKGQYQAVLPDGTNVWLNAETSLRYPTAFTGKERAVTLEGEAYFEVAHHPEQPFVVTTKSQRLKVLGTVFNINAYANELNTVTTLVSGSVELNSAGTDLPYILKPDQQAVLAQDGYQVRAVDVTPYIAWKAGEFRFSATPLPEVLHQIERWYDLEIDYSGIPKGIRLHASMQRDKNLSSILYALEKTSGLKFEINGGRLQLVE